MAIIKCDVVILIELVSLLDKFNQENKNAQRKKLGRNSLVFRRGIQKRETPLHNRINVDKWETKHAVIMSMSALGFVGVVSANVKTLYCSGGKLNYTRTSIIQTSWDHM